MKKRILILDGPKGTMIQRKQLTEADYRGDRFKDWKGNLKGDNDILCITQPEIIMSIHEEHMAAGSDIIQTNTFNGTSFSQADFGMQEHVYELNLCAARIALEAAAKWTKKTPDKPRFVAGSLGPTNKSASVAGDVENPGHRSVTWNELYEAYSEPVRAFLDAGVDLIIIETIFDTLNGKAALAASIDAMRARSLDVPIMVSGTIVDLSGRNLSGQTVDAFLASMDRPEVFSIGLNCSLGANQMKPFLAALAKHAPFPVSCYPNAGMPNQFGGYDDSPEGMARELGGFCADGYINIMGGCCGSTPRHIELLSAEALKHKPRIVPARDRVTRLAGLEPLAITLETNFVNIGERTNVAGSKKFARLIKDGKYSEALSVARDMVDSGAQVIDVCMDDAMLDAKACMARFLALMGSDPEIARVPFMIDSSKWEVIEEGLRHVQGKVLVNSISLKEGTEPFLAKAAVARQFGAAVVVMLFDEKGQADSLERRKEIARRAYDCLVGSGFPPEDIVIDPNVLAVATGLEAHDRYALEFIQTCEWIKANLPYAKISGGISNLSFSFRGNDRVREAMHSVFLYHAIKAGMDMGIVNPGSLVVYDEIDAPLREAVEDVILYRRKDAAERLLSYAERLVEEGQTGSAAGDDRGGDKLAWRALPLDDRIAHALIKGVEEFIEADTAEAHAALGDPLAVIEGPLMNAMNKVGELFGSGRMFLPQVIKSARVMKLAVAVLEPAILAKKSGSSRGRILLATVKGDVHDIGKNIVGVVLGCNGYDIVDLGVMVSTETILDEAVRQKADIIGVSGLITPSLEEMVEVAREMKKRGLSIPLMLGGATTSAMHTACKVRPEYDRGVVYVKDASRAVGTVRSLLSASQKSAYLESIDAEYAKLRNAHDASRPSVAPLAQARSQHAAPDFSLGAAKPQRLGVIHYDDYPLAELVPYIDWTFFLYAWDMKGRWPEVLDDAVRGPEARKLVDDGKALLDLIVRDKKLHAKAAVGIWPANALPLSASPGETSRGEDVALWTDEGRTSELARFSFLRAQDRPVGKQSSPCLADYLAQPEQGPDWMGAFACSAGFGARELSEAYAAAGDDYNAIMCKILADRLAEALAERLHERVRTEIWAYAAGEKLSPQSLLDVKYSGIRPAPGYPACPVHADKALLWKLLDVGALGMKLTESWMMMPAASVSGFYFAHPEARYFNLGKIGRDQLSDWAARSGLSLAEAERRLRPNLD